MSNTAKILVADDDRAIRTVLSQALGRLGLDESVLVSPGWPDLGLTAMLRTRGEAMLLT